MPIGFFHALGGRRCFVGTLTVLILSFAVYVAYRGRSAPTEPELEIEPLPASGLVLEPRPVTLVRGIHLLGGLAPAAAYVVETSDGVVLIDSGIEPDARSLKAQLEYLGVDRRRLRAILLTHAHGDHSGGAEQLRATTGAKVYAGEADAAVLRAGQPREAFFSTFSVPADARPVPTRVDVELRGGESIEIGNARFRVIATPGHTPGSTCYLLERGGQRILFSGDVVMSLSGNDAAKSPHARSLGTYAAYLAPRYRGDALAFLDTLRSLRAMPAPDFVLPGHPRNDDTPQNPYMTQPRWEALLDGGIREMEQLLEQHARDGALFLDDVPKELLPGLYYLGDISGVAVYGFFAAPGFFLVNAPGGPGPSEFVKGRLRRLGAPPRSPTAILLTSGVAAETAGLKDLLGTWKTCAVVAPALARDSIKDTCPAGTSIIGPEELLRRNWFEVEPIVGGRRTLRSIAYQLRWEGKSVLISGRLPIKPPSAVRTQVLREFMHSLGNPGELRDALDQLKKLKPDLWLPALPADGQNANLYSGDWHEIVTQNEDLLGS